MQNRYVLCCALCCALLALLTSATQLQAQTRSLALALELAGARSQLNGTADRGQFGSGEIVSGLRDGEFDTNAERDTSAALGLRLSRRWRGARFGVAAYHHFAVDWDLAAVTPRIDTITNTFTNVERDLLLVSIAIDRPLSGAWRWQAGIGAGIARHTLDTDYIERAVPNERPELLRSARRRETNAAWAVELGLTRPLAERWSIGLHYRYLNTGQLRIDATPDTSATLSTRLFDQQLLMAIGFHLQGSR